MITQCFIALMIFTSTRAFGQTPAFPAAVATDEQLGVASNAAQTTLAANVDINDPAMKVADCSRIAPNTLFRVDSEIVFETAVSTNCTLTVTRAFDGTTAVRHNSGAIVSAYLGAWNMNAADAEIKAIEANTAPVINIKAFGAIGDGVHNDTAAIQSAINAAGSGNIVFIPPGNYLTDAITMKAGVELRCASMYGSTFLASSNDMVMFTISATSHTGISNCSVSGNRKTGVQFLDINTYPNTNNKFRDLYVHDVASGIRTSNTYFDIFDNVRVFQPTVAGFMFSANSNSITCNNCSILSTTPGTIGLQVNNSGAFVFNGGTLEGTVSTSLYQLNAATFTGTYWENSGSVNPGAWVNVGTAAGTQTGGINFIGCNFGVGANYALRITQVYGLVAKGNSINTKLAAFYIDNQANSPKYGLDLAGNQYNINAAGYDATRIFLFAGAPDNTLNSNINQDVVGPLLFTATPEPPDASIQNAQGVMYFDLRQHLWYKYKDGSGTVRRWLIGSDAPYDNPNSASTNTSLPYVTTQVNPSGPGSQAGLPFASLRPATNGTIQYCTDCRNIQDGAAPGSTAVAGGTGAFLAGVNSRWRIMN